MITRKITSWSARVAFCVASVELFDKLAVEIHAEDIQKDRIFILCRR